MTRIRSVIYAVAVNDASTYTRRNKFEVSQREGVSGSNKNEPQSQTRLGSP